MNYWKELDREWDMWENNGYTPDEVSFIHDMYILKDVSEIHYYAFCHGLDADKIVRGYRIYDNYRKNLG